MAFAGVTLPMKIGTSLKPVDDERPDWDRGVTLPIKVGTSLKLVQHTAKERRRHVTLPMKIGNSLKHHVVDPQELGRGRFADEDRHLVEATTVSRLPRLDSSLCR